MIKYPSDVSRLPVKDRKAAYDSLVADSKFLDDTLLNRISAGISLSDSEIESAVEVLGKRCREKGKDEIRWALRACPTMRPRRIYDRVEFHDGVVFYCAGQDYRAELKLVRKYLIGR